MKEFAKTVVKMSRISMICFQMLALLSAASHVCASKKFVKVQSKVTAILNHALLKTAFEWIRNYYTAQSSSGINVLALLSLLPCTDENFDFTFFIKVYTENTLLARHRPSVHVVVLPFLISFSC